MNRILVAAVSFLAAVGCATSGSAGGPNVTETGTVTGVLSFGEGVNAPANFCDLLEVTASAGGQQVAQAAVRQSRNRCSFDLTRLPAGTELKVTANAEGLACENGGSLTVEPESRTVTLVKNEFEMVDFKARCG